MWATYVPLWNTLAKQSVLWTATKKLKKGCFRNLATAINYVWSLVTVFMTTFYGKLKLTHFCCYWYCYCYCRVVVFAVAVAAVFFVVLVLVVVFIIVIVIATVIIIVQSLSRFNWLKWITLIFHNYFFCFPFQENNFTIWLGFWYKEFQAKVLLERVLMTSLPSKSRCLIIIIAFFFFFFFVVQLTCTLHQTVIIRGMFA